MLLIDFSFTFQILLIEAEHHVFRFYTLLLLAEQIAGKQNFSFQLILIEDKPDNQAWAPDHINLRRWTSVGLALTQNIDRLK